MYNDDLLRRKNMLNYQEKVIKLIEKRKSKNRILAACIYGSRVQGTASFHSDLDVLLITDGEENYRGCYKIGELTVEYTEKSFYTIMNEMELYEQKRNAFYHSFFAHQIVVFDQGDFFPFLKSYLQKLQSLNLAETDFTKQDYKELGIARYNWESHKKDCLSNYYYYLYLECLRQKYHKMSHCSYIQPKNVYSVYKNPEKANLYCESLPEESYLKFFVNCIEKEYITVYEKEKRLKYASDCLNLSDDLIDCEEESILVNNKINIKQQLILSYHQLQKIRYSYVNHEPVIYAYSHLMNHINQLHTILNPQWIFQKIEPNELATQLNIWAQQAEIDLNEYEIPIFTKKYENK